MSRLSIAAAVFALSACGGGSGSTAAEAGMDGGMDESMDSADTSSADASGSESAGDGDDSGDGDGTGDGDGGPPPCGSVGPWPDQTTAWVASGDPDGVPVNSAGSPSLSANGRFVAFIANIDPLGGSGGFLSQAYVYDASCDTTMLVPFEPPEDPVTQVIWVAISGDASTVAFHTGDGNQDSFVYAYDLDTDTIEEISVGATAGLNERPTLSHDGRFVAFQSDQVLHADDTNGEIDVYLHDRETSVTELISRATDGTVGDRFSQFPSISADGRFVAFESLASNLSDEDSIGYDVFVRDRQTTTTELVSPTSMPSAGGSSNWPTISADGRFVAFQSDSDHVIPDPPTASIEVFVYDRDLDTVERVSLDDAGQGLTLPAWSPKISGDGNRVLFTVGSVTGGGNEAQAWLRDRAAGTLTHATVNAMGDPTDLDVVNLALSADGAWAGFETRAMNLTDPPEVGAGWDAFVVGVP